MKNSKVIIAGSTLILSIAGVIVSKASKSQHTARVWTCTMGGMCSSSYGIWRSVTKQESRQTLIVNLTKGHTCEIRQYCGKTLHTRFMD